MTRWGESLLRRHNVSPRTVFFYAAVVVVHVIVFAPPSLQHTIDLGFIVFTLVLQQVADDDRTLLPALECLASIVIAVGPALEVCVSVYMCACHHAACCICLRFMSCCCVVVYTDF